MPLPSYVLQVDPKLLLAAAWDLDFLQLFFMFVYIVSIFLATFKHIVITPLNYALGPSIWTGI